MRRTTLGRRRCLAAALALAVGALDVGLAPRVASQATPTAAAIGTPAAPLALLNHAAQTMSGVRTFHFVLTNEQGTTSLPDGLTFSAATGDVERPDRFEAKVQTKLKLLPITVTIVGVGSKVFYQNPITHHFHEISSSTAALALLNPAPLLVAAINQIQHPVISGPEKVNDVPTTRVNGFLDIPATGPSTPSALPFDTGGKPLPLSIWIDATGHTLQLRLTGPLREGDSSDVVRQLDLSNFNESVNIQAPGG